MFESHKPGSDLTIMNTFYQYGRRNDDGTRDPDFLIVNYKDNTTGKKYHDLYKHPEIEFYTDGSQYNVNRIQIAVYKYLYKDPDKKIETEITRRTLIRKPNEIVYDQSKDEYVIINAMEFDDMDERYIHIPKNKMMFFYELNDGDYTYAKFFEEEHNLIKHKCRYSDVDKYLCKLSNNMDFYNKCISNGDRRTIKMIHYLTGIYRSDLNIESYARYVFANRFTNNVEKITKAFYDIETDGAKYPIPKDKVEPDGEVPINAFAYFDETNPDQYILYQFLLRDPTNPQIEQYEKEYKSGIFGEKQIKEFVLSKMGSKKFYKYRMDKCRYKILFYDSEIQMLTDIFGLIHKSSPDFLSAWNGSAYDFQDIINRVINLGYDPENILCDKSWEDVKVVKNYIDQKNISDLAERGDYSYLSGDVNIIDAEIQFASRRKSKIGSFDSFRLDDIGELTTGIKKLDYSYITNDILLLPKLNYKIFSLYNMFDVIVMHCIEFKNQDLEYLFSQAILNNTSYNKAHRQTQYLINKMINNFELEEGNYILTNNRNKESIKRKKKFPGVMMLSLFSNEWVSKVLNAGNGLRLCTTT